MLLDKIEPTFRVALLQNQTECFVAPKDRKSGPDATPERPSIAKANLQTHPTTAVIHGGHRTPYRGLFVYLVNLLCRAFYGRSWLSWEHESAALRFLLPTPEGIWPIEGSAVVLRVSHLNGLDDVVAPRLTLKSDEIFNLEPRWQLPQKYGAWWVAELKRLDVQLAKKAPEVPQRSAWALVRLSSADELSSGLRLPKYLEAQLDVSHGDQVVVRPVQHYFAGLRGISLTIALDATQVMSPFIC